MRLQAILIIMFTICRSARAQRPATQRNAGRPVGRFSFADAQAAMHACTGAGPAFAPDANKFAAWDSTSALGNALNGWAATFFYALATGRQPAAAGGRTPDAFCGPAGAFACGVPYLSGADMHRAARHKQKPPPDARVVTGFFTAFQYRGAAHALGRVRGDYPELGSNGTLAACAVEALRCDRGSLDKEACVMARAAQHLLPGLRLRPAFAAAVAVEADHWWLGDHAELRRLVAAAAGNVTAGPRFFDPAESPPTDERWAGALHLRSFHVDGAGKEGFERWVDEMAASPVWACARGAAAALGPGSFVLATDAKGLCRAVRERVPGVACIGQDPAHMTKVRVKALHEAHADGLTSHHAILLDWFSLAKSRWLGPGLIRGAYGKGAGCMLGAQRAGLHGVSAPGKSFAGWAMAASGLAHASGGPQCACGVTAGQVSALAAPAPAPGAAPKY